MRIDVRAMPFATKVQILLEAIFSLILIGLGIMAKETLVICFAILLWVFIIDMIVIESKEQFIRMLDLLCDVQQEILAEKFGCTRSEVDIMCTEKLMERNEKSR